MASDRPLTIAAVGDVSFQGVTADPSVEIFGNVSPLLRSSDLVIANLESPLAEGGAATPGKCTLRGSPQWAEVLRDAGIGVVSLANNHTMDFGPEGLEETIRALDAAGVSRVGAGRTRTEAAAPLHLQVGGHHVAVLARTSVVVSAPGYVAGDTPGVAFLDVDETCAAIRRARANGGFVVLVLHWGLEEYRYPSPDQRRLARQFAEAGADAIVGHHPHVTQGMERLGSCIVAYSLGNYLFHDFDWEYRSETGETRQVRMKLSPQNRDGAVLRLTGGRGECVPIVEYTRVGDTDRVELDSHPARGLEWQSLSAQLGSPMYEPWWRYYALRREWRLRLVTTLSPAHMLKKLHRVRPRHFKQAVHALRRSANVVSERSTNPYE
jgi:poly-gamma-glutamate synthesis protein (capsule biosynthesis protein)